MGGISSPGPILLMGQCNSSMRTPGYELLLVSVLRYTHHFSQRQNGLVEVNDQGNAVMRVETTPQVANNRQSIRITTQSQINGGLVIMDAVHMPTGCGTWPAFWSNGPNWPAGGEIDIVEGVNNYTNNQATIHTDPGCSIPDPSTL